MRINFHKKEYMLLRPIRPSSLSLKLSTMKIVEEYEDEEENEG